MKVPGGSIGPKSSLCGPENCAPSDLHLTLEASAPILAAFGKTCLCGGVTACRVEEQERKQAEPQLCSSWRYSHGTGWELGSAPGLVSSLPREMQPGFSSSCQQIAWSLGTSVSASETKILHNLVQSQTLCEIKKAHLCLHMNPERANREQGKSQRQRVRQLGGLLSRKPFPSKKLYPSQSSHTEKQLILPSY